MKPCGKSFIGHDIFQSLIFSHVTTVSTIQNTANSETLWYLIRLAQKYFQIVITSRLYSILLDLHLNL